MACERAEGDAVPVGADQGLSGGIAGCGSCCQLWHEICDGTVPVGVADFDEDGGGCEELRVGADAVDGIFCIVDRKSAS